MFNPLTFLISKFSSILPFRWPLIHLIPLRTCPVTHLSLFNNLSYTNTLPYTNDLPYAADLPYTTDLPYAALCGWPTLCHPTPDLPYTTLHQTCPTPVTYPMPTTYLTPKTYSTPSSLSICKLSLAMTPSTPLLNPQVHERFLLRMVPYSVMRQANQL